MSKKTNNYVVTLVEYNGQYEYQTSYLIATTETDEEKILKKEEKESRGFSDDDWEEDTQRYFNGEVAVQGYNIVKISKKDFNILNKYI